MHGNQCEIEEIYKLCKKNIAKSYGAKWDIVEKKWYYLDTLDEINKQKLKEL